MWSIIREPPPRPFGPRLAISKELSWIDLVILVVIYVAD
jgi:hypothetical protein